MLAFESDAERDDEDEVNPFLSADDESDEDDDEDDGLEAEPSEVAGADKP